MGGMDVGVGRDCGETTHGECRGHGEGGKRVSGLSAVGSGGSGSVEGGGAELGASV